MPDQPSTPLLLPRPAHLAVEVGSLQLPERVAIQASKGLEREVEALERYHVAVSVRVGGAPEIGTPGIELALSCEYEAEFSKEGYRLSVTHAGVLLRATHPQGLFHGLQTLRQLLLQGRGIDGVSLPVVEIKDAPKFAWRGMMLDVSRHFFSVDEIKGILDLLAFHKINVFHWHLTDDGGWRFEVDKFPNLTTHGAWREVKGHLWDYFDIDFPGRDGAKPTYGGFYSKQELREIVAYAAERYIEVLPEIDVPGHSLAACASYPELTCDAHARERFLAETRMHAPNVLCAGQESTYTFMEEVLTEVMEIFPSKVIHVGGDEVSKILWKNCAHCQERMRNEGLADEDQLQSYFIGRLGRFLASKGRRLMGWDEILEGGLPADAMVMSWRGVRGGIEAARSGHEVVMTPTTYCYLDYDHATVTMDTALSFDPRNGLTEEEGKYVLGGQANLWTEYVPTIQAAQQRMFPRLAGIAEALWSGVGEEPFTSRMPHYLALLREMGVSFYQEDVALVGAFQEGVVYLNS